MNLTSVKYQDSCIYIGLNGPRDERESEAFLQKVKSVYVVYKIKAFGRQVRETVLIGKKDLILKEKELILKFELRQLHSPEDSQIEIGKLKINFREDKSEVLLINETYPFSEIRAKAPIAPGKKKLIKEKNNAPKIKTIYVLEERYFDGYKGPNLAKSSKIDTDKLKESPKSQKKKLNPEINRFKEVLVATDCLTVIDETTPISTVISEIESEIESKLDLETIKLDMDIRQLCYGTIDLLLTNIPLQEFSDEHSASNAMVRAIHKYINADLLRQKESEEEGVESA